MKSLFLSVFLLTLIGGGQLMAQTTVLGKDWTLQRPHPTGDNLRSIAVNGTASLVAVGGHGTILTAPALTGANAWNPNVVTGLKADLWDVIYTGSSNGNKYIAVGSSGTILTASDTLATTPTGLTWTAMPTSATDATKLNVTDQYNAVDFSGTTVVAVGATAAGGGVAAISTDGGATWVRRLVASSTSLKDVTFQGTTIWAVMDGYLMRSTNNTVSWAKFSLGTSTTVNSVAYAVPTAQSTLPALNVTGSTSFIAINGGSLSIGSAPPNAVVVSTGAELIGVTRTGALSHSDNAGLSWGTLSATQTTPFNKATRFGNTYVAVGDGGAIWSYVVGGNWTALTAVGSILPANALAWNEKTGADSLIVAVGSGITWTSPDAGVTWTEHLQTMPNTTTPMTMYAVMWSGSYFVAVGNGLWVSSDGVTWTSQKAAPTSGAVYAVAALNGTPYALGYDKSKKLVNISAGDLQGYAWEDFKAIPGAQWAMLGITKSDAGLFVAAGWGGRVLTNTSPGIKAWSPYTVALASGEDFTDVLWANNQFTAVTNKGGIWTSTNGSTWVKRKTASQPLWCITRVKHAPNSGKDEQFIAAGNHGLLVTSFNGQEWVESDTGSSQFTNQILSIPSTDIKTVTHTDTEVVTTVTTTYTLDTSAHTLTTNIKRETATSPVTRVEEVTTLKGNPVVERIRSVSSTTGTATVVTTNDAPTTTDSQLATAPPTAVSTSSSTTRDTAAATTVQGATTDELLIAAGGYGSFRASTGTPPVQPDVSFAVATSSVSEADQTTGAVVTVNLSAANPLPVTVTFGFAGTAPSNTYKRSVASVTFPANDTTPQTVTIKPVQDAIDRHNATVIISITSLTGDVKKGANPTHTVTINDDEHAPNMNATEPSSLVYVGDSVTLNSTSTYTGTPTWQWQKNGVNIVGATQTYYLIPNVALADAASYTVTGKNAAGTGTSDPVKLAVLDPANQIVTAKTNGGTYPTLTVRAAGTGLSFQWQRNGTNITGATSSSLLLTSATAVNNDVFKCLVTSAEVKVGGAVIQPSVTLPSGTFTLITVAGQPVITTPSMGGGQVGKAYSFVPVAAPAASLWTITGLPAGLTYVSSTGAISGTPTRAGTFIVRFLASNAFGTLAPVTAPLVITSLPVNAVGTYMAIVDANDTVNLGLGARLDVVTTTTGGFTGKLVETGGSYPFYGNLSGSDNTLRSGAVQLPGKLINFTLNSSTGALSGTVTSGVVSASAIGWRKTIAGTNRAGNYTIALNPAANTDGSSYAMFTIKSTGDVTFSGRLANANASSFTTSAFVGPNGELGLFQSIFTGTNNANRGSIQGRMQLNQGATAPFADNSIIGDVDFAIINAPAVTPTVIPYTVAGGRYIAPAAGKIVMNLSPVGNNANLTFLGADLATDARNPDGLFTITSPAKVIPPSTNDAATGLAFVPATGAFSGGFELFDNGIPRNAQFYGVLIRPGGSSVMIGKGFFVVEALSPATGVLVGSVNLASH